MASWDYVEWYNRQSIWLRVFLFPVVVTVMFIHIMGALAWLLLVSLFVMFSARIDYWRFWRKLRERGQVGRWPEEKMQVISGSGTLIVEVTPIGLGTSWLIHHPRDAVDPEHVVPSWQQFEEQRQDSFKSPVAASESVNRWSVEQLGVYESSARAFALSWKELAELGVEVKQRSVLAVLPCEGSLTRRCRLAGR